MKPIVESKGVRLSCPIDGRYAFFNSPYPGHKENASVDIYPSDWYGGDMPSPVDGEVVHIRRLKAPIGHGFEAADHETVIVLENRDNPETVTKLLHIDPFVEVGDSLRVGESIGLTLRSGYYGSATSPHAHVEVRRPDDPIRARGGYSLNLIEVPSGEPVSEISGMVVQLQPEYAYIKLDTNDPGLVGTVNGEPAVLDGGIPYYGWLGAHLLDAPGRGTIELLGQPIADITENFNNSCKGTCREFSFTLNDQKLLGLSLVIWPSRDPLVKAVPLQKNRLNLEIGQWVEIGLKVS
jgi:hypothetical protein